MSGRESHRDGDHQHHHVRDALSAAGDASAELLATMFADTYNEPWEDAVRRYDASHAATDRQPGGAA